MRKYFFSILIVALALCGCSKSSDFKVTATGSIYEMLVVMNDNYWEGASGDSLRSYIEADMPCMPQMESYFTVMHTPLVNFDDALMATRNILIVDVDMRYNEPKITYQKDVYAHPQAVVTMHLPIDIPVAEYIGQNGKDIQNFFVRQELLRQAEFYKSDYNHKAKELLAQKFGIEMYVPSDFQVIMEDKDFVWCCNDNGSKRRDLVVYSYPYTDPNTFTKDFLCEKRDTMLHRIEGYKEGCYMGTEYNVFPPIYKAIAVNNMGYCGELRGLWKMKTDIPGNGIAMGGPFVQHTRLDEINQRIITVEGFVYAAGQKKRNVYRQTEAILYTMKLPQEINAIKEITVTATNSEE